MRTGSLFRSGPGSVVGIATGYGPDGTRIESRRGRVFSAPVQTGPGAHPASYTIGTGSFPGVKSGRGVVKKEYSYTSTPPMGRMTCKDPQCLYRGAFYLFIYLFTFSFAGCSDDSVALTTDPPPI